MFTSSIQKGIYDKPLLVPQWKIDIVAAADQYSWANGK